MFLAGVLGAAGLIAQMRVTNAASFDSSQPMAPGSFAAVFGQDLCAQTAAGDWIAPGQLPTSLGGCSVTVNGTAAMMQYASPGQINFIVPQGAGTGQANVIVNNGSQLVPGSMMLGPAGPGIFALNGMGVGEGAMLHGTMWRLGPFSTATNGQPTPIAIYVTGLDLSSKPMVVIGGIPAEVTWFGDAPGYAGLQQININMPAGAAGAGRVPVTVSSNGQTSNVTFMHVLPTTSMMQGMPGWGQGMMVGENMPRGREVSYLALNPANNSVLVTDENDDVVRVISVESKVTTSTITLPAGSQAHSIAVNAAGTLAAVALSAKASVGLIDLSQNKVVSVIGTGFYPSRVAFAGANLLVTDQAGGTVSMIDSGTRMLIQTVNVGFGPSGIAATPALAVVANMQGGSVSVVNLSNYSVKTIALPAGSRPHEVAISAAPNKALITEPTGNGFYILDLGTNALTHVETNTWNGMGPGGVAVNGSSGYIANQMTARITMVDLVAGTVLKTFPVDPGPRALAVNPANNQLLVLAEGTGTLDVVDLGTYSIVVRLNAGDTERQGQWTLPQISSIAPSTAAAGNTFVLTIAGSGLQSVKGLEFHLTGLGNGMGGGMMGGGMGQGMGAEDANIKVSSVQVNAAGTKVTASVQVLAAATAGTRQVRLQTDRGEVMGMAVNSTFTVTK
jgi:uncharacterized protein (TIGR03437 family)